MINIILPLTCDYDKAKELISSVKRKGVTFIIGVTSAAAGVFKNTAKQKVYVFENGSKKEEMINSLAQFVTAERLIILRKIITAEELFAFIDSNADVTVCQTKTRKKVGAFFNRLWQKFVGFIFGFKFFNGDISVVSLNELSTQVALQSKNLSYITRVNRWKGMTQNAVATSSPPAKMEYDVGKSFGFLFAYIALFVAVITGSALYFALCPIIFVLALLWAALILTSTLLLVIGIIIFILNVKTGKRVFKNAKLEVKNG